MIDLKRYFRNPFADKEISTTELQKFAEDHLAKLAAANEGGSYDARITDTTAAYEGYFGELTNVSLRVAVQKAATQTMKERWTEFVKWMTGKGEARVKDRADKPSAVYTEFFPTGLTEYHSANVADGQTLARRVKASAAAIASGPSAASVRPTGAARRPDMATCFGQGITETGTGGLAGTG